MNPAQGRPVPQFSPVTPTIQPTIQPPHFNTPPKLKPVDQVMREYPGDSISNLQKLAGALARDAIFGKDALRAGGLRGGGKEKKLETLDKEKMGYIKSVVRTRVPNISSIAYEAIWDKCRTTILKACQLLREKQKKK